MRHIAFSLFGYSTKNDNSLNFDVFLHNLSANIRGYKILMPDWKIMLYLEREVYYHYGQYIDKLKSHNLIDFCLMQSGQLCENMLWRMFSVHSADYTICRDLDSFPSVREANAVHHWTLINTDFHAISDNKEHNQPLMGGMIGYKKNSFSLVELISQINEQKKEGYFNEKGSDQFFLKDIFYGKKTMTEHRISGLTKEKIKKFILQNHSNDYFYDYIPENIEFNLTNDERAIFDKHYIGKPIQDFTDEEKNEILGLLSEKTPELNEILL